MQNALLAEIVERLPDPVFVVRAEQDAGRRVVLANAAARDIFRHPDPNPRDRGALAR